jgi:FtsP/CotA-like multicopper oxidase with cupredoxin domain
MAKFNRRQFLALSTVGVGTAIAVNWVMGKETQPASPSSVSLPRTILSQDGLLELELEASYRPVKLGDQQAYLLCYNGQVPAPCLEAMAGDTVRIHFTNNLSEPTNIHYHGLHIPPTGNADNTFLSIDPGEKLTYEFIIPQNHPAGTFWYHPHLHGYVAEQLFGGLAGMFIVRGELDEIPEVKAAKEEIVILKDFALDDRGYLLPPDRHQVMMNGREGELLTINGQVNFFYLLPLAGCCVCAC